LKIDIPSLTPSDPKLWIKANTAAQRLGEKMHSPLAAKDTLADYLRDGLLQAQAKSITVSENESLSLAWKNHPKLDDKDMYMTVSANEWRKSKRWNGDRADWRWPGSNFSVTARRKPLLRYLYFRVEFALPDLARLQPAVFNKRHGVGGSKGKPDSRDAFWQAVVQLALDGRLDIAGIRSQTELIAEIHAINGPGEPVYGDSVMKKLASQVWKKFIEPKRSVD
jgi:hypothetical protein